MEIESERDSVGEREGLKREYGKKKDRCDARREEIEKVIYRYCVR